MVCFVRYYSQTQQLQVPTALYDNKTENKKQMHQYQGGCVITVSDTNAVTQLEIIKNSQKSEASV